MSTASVVVDPQRQQENQPRPIQASFLGLPIELRIAIYEYLIPNDKVPCRKFEDPERWPLRHDGQLCSTAILCINHQIYTEVISMWYGTASFGMSMTGRYLKALQHTIYDQNSKLHPNFRFIRSLRLAIMLQWTRKPASNEYFALKPWTSLLAEVLSAGPYNMRHISLYHVKFYDSQLSKIIKSCCEDRCKAFKAVLEQNLGPLRMMRGVVLEFDGIDNIGGRGLPLEDGIALSSHPRHMALRALSEMKRARRNFLTDLAKDVFQQS